MPKISETQRSDRRRAVLHSVEVVFSSRGFTAATIDDIAREAGVSKGYVYTYFSSKEDIFLAVVRDFDDVTNRWKLFIDSIASTRGMRVEERLLALWDTIAAQWSADNLSRVKLQLEIWSQASRNLKLREAIGTRSSRSLGLVETILEESAPEFIPESDYSILARLWWAVIDGLVLYWIGHGTAPSTGELRSIRHTLVLLNLRLRMSNREIMRI